MRNLVKGVVIVAALSCGFATRAAAQTCTPNAGPFCIDKVIAPTNGNPANNSGLAPGAATVVDPNGSTKELGPVNGSTTKILPIHTAAPPMLSLTNPNGQVDLNAIWTQTAPAGNGDIWFYFAWSRDASSGSGFMSIELQQSKVSAACNYTTQTSAQLIATCNPWANRQAGDFILLWDQQGGSRDIYKRVFTLVGNALVLGAPTLLGSAVAEFSTDGFRGEAAVNLSDDVFPQDGSCVTFANTIPGTVTGNSDSADYKDTVLANFEPVANCGTVIVKKTTIPAGQTGSFPYTLARQGALVRFAADALEHPEDGDAPQTQITRTLLADQASETHVDLIPAANYTLQEGDVSPTWQLDSIICTVNGDPAGSDIKAGGTFAVEVGTITRCTITNRLALADLKIIKTVVNGSGLTKTPGDFTFSRDGGAAEPFANNDVSCTSGAVCKTISYPVGATFSVVEVGIAEGYTQTGAVGCSGTIATTGNTCTITNTAQPAQPTILTVQRVILHDSANIAGVRRFAGETALQVTFVLYPSLAACNAGTGALGSEVRTVTFANGTATSGSATTATGVSVDTNAGPYFWKVTSAGNNANASFVSGCGREQTAVTFTYQ